MWSTEAAAAFYRWFVHRRVEEREVETETDQRQTLCLFDGGRVSSLQLVLVAFSQDSAMCVWSSEPNAPELIPLMFVIS